MAKLLLVELLWVCCFAIGTYSSNAFQLLNITIAKDASFRIFIGEIVWFESAPLRVFANGAWNKLVQTGIVHSHGTDDTFGKFSCVNISWRTSTFRNGYDAEIENPPPVLVSF